MAHALSFEAAISLAAGHCLVPGCVDVWIVDIETSCSAEQLVSCLSDQERQRAERYKHARPRNQFIVGRALLRHLLGAATGAEPDAITFDRLSTGKPILHDVASPYFNLSHSDNYIAVAIALDRAVGVDIECVSQYVNIDAISEQFFNASELEIMTRTPLEDSLDKFYELWTRKEALLKGLGIGWAEYMQATPELRDSLHQDWRIESLRATTDGWLAIASKGDWQLRFVAGH